MRLTRRHRLVAPGEPAPAVAHRDRAPQVHGDGLGHRADVQRQADRRDRPGRQPGPQVSRQPAGPRQQVGGGLQDQLACGPLGPRPPHRAGVGAAPELIRYVLVGISAGEVAALPAMALRSAPVQIFGSGLGGRAALAESAAAYESILEMAAAGEITLDVEPLPLSGVEKAWARQEGGRRVVFVP